MMVMELPSVFFVNDLVFHAVKKSAVVITMVQTRYCMIPISEEIKLAKKRAKILGKSSRLCCRLHTILKVLFFSKN